MRHGVQLGTKFVVQKDGLRSALVQVGDVIEVVECYTNGFDGQVMTLGPRYGKIWCFSYDDVCSGLRFDWDPPPVLEVKEPELEVNKSIDKHYNFYYNLNQQEKDSNTLKVDPYFVSKQWKLGDKDNTGCIFHILKTIARFGEKNSKEREIKAMYLQIKRLAELEGVELNG